MEKSTSLLIGLFLITSLVLLYPNMVQAQDYFGKFPPTTAFRNFTDGTDTIEAGGYADTLTMTAGANMTIDFFPLNNTIIFASQGGGGPCGGHTEVNSIACALDQFLSAYDNGTSFFTCALVNLSGLAGFENVTLLNETNQYFIGSVQFFRDDLNVLNSTNSTIFSVQPETPETFIYEGNLNMSTGDGQGDIQGNITNVFAIKFRSNPDTDGLGDSQSCDGCLPPKSPDCGSSQICEEITIAYGHWSNTDWLYIDGSILMTG